MLAAATCADSEEAAMKTDETKDEWPPFGENDPAPDASREMAAYERERPRLVREHLGKIAVIHGEDLVGVYDNCSDAVIDSRTRLGWARMLYIEITASDEPEYVTNVDINHPSFKRID
jgi:hypothetical protein